MCLLNLAINLEIWSFKISISWFRTQFCSAYIEVTQSQTKLVPFKVADTRLQLSAEVEL